MTPRILLALTLTLGASPLALCNNETTPTEPQGGGGPLHPEANVSAAAAAVKQGVVEPAIAHALKLWEAGEQPKTPTDWGCFEVFDTIQKQIDAGS